MKTYQSFGAFAKALARVSERLPATLEVVAETSAELVKETAKAKIGHYQAEVGPFPAWPELTRETQADRVRQGFTPNDPLLRSGDLRDSIESTAAPDGFLVGSQSEIAVYQELGTEHIPPRPFLAPALLESTPAILSQLGAAIERTLAGEKP